jgi:tetratricopeptide (TPR) repeat protein
MKHMQTDKYTIAWFKIADCVSRGEKERALGVYRLLSHSFNDDAVSRQLEADIYLSCNEQIRAIGLYRQAMELYAKSQRFLEAAAVGEHLVMLLPNDILLRGDLINNYITLRALSKIYHHIQALMVGHTKKDNLSFVMTCVEKVIDVMVQEGQEKKIQDFLSMISVLDEQLYNHACAYSRK